MAVGQKAQADAKTGSTQATTVLTRATYMSSSTLSFTSVTKKRR